MWGEGRRQGIAKLRGKGQGAWVGSGEEGMSEGVRLEEEREGRRMRKEEEGEERD